MTMQDWKKEIEKAVDLYCEGRISPLHLVDKLNDATNKYTSERTKNANNPGEWIVTYKGAK